MILLKITGKLASTPPTYDLLARDYFSLTVLLTACLQWWTPVMGSPCLLDQGQWTFHLGSPENDPIDFSTLGY